ncbi:MAG TPA: [Fe-Fe] hydrogenase large subunit C-terminal domain-containing protein, partial [Spirochaetota bacterium]|nr:[Fe-Fe] hydrogenase large subunit C-terminal domain-containing protein [Spirochaetota bacterium]
MEKLSKIIGIDEKKCVNCHKCIAACPVKFCNDGSKDHVSINENLCVGCGNCLTACTHEARYIIDDFGDFLDGLMKKEKSIAFVAPSVVVHFPEEYLKFNGWLKSLGIEAIFDVSFGAELTVKSYINHILKNRPKTVISQPCPAIVTYIQIYKPQLIKHLAPVHSPMLHAIKMVKNFYPEYKNHKITVISPCIAKKREFEETGLGDYNVTFESIINYIDEKKIKISAFKETEYSNPPAERAVVFSTPGGLLETALREVKDINKKTRKIEGPSVIYDYLETFSEAIEKNAQPLLVDCLNCEKGCNGGTATKTKNLPA